MTYVDLILLQVGLIGWSLFGIMIYLRRRDNS
jgi:hypothetical protein